jgi:signal transduction histidine kinase
MDETRIKKSGVGSQKKKKEKSGKDQEDGTGRLKPESKSTRPSGSGLKEEKRPAAGGSGVAKSREPAGQSDSSSLEDLREFLFRAIHDLRTPLQAILGYSTLVLRKVGDQIPGQQKENLQRVVWSAERLNAMIDQMADHLRAKD